MQILRYFYVFLFSLILSVSACYVPTGPDIFGVHISCHFNPGYVDHLWILQVWVVHHVQLEDIEEVEVSLYNAYSERSYFTLQPSGNYLWDSLVLQKNTNLGCGRWYTVDIVATDKYGYTDVFETYYQN